MEFAIINCHFPRSACFLYRPKKKGKGWLHIQHKLLHPRFRGHCQGQGRGALRDRGTGSFLRLCLLEMSKKLCSRSTTRMAAYHDLNKDNDGHTHVKAEISWHLTPQQRAIGKDEVWRVEIIFLQGWVHTWLSRTKWSALQSYTVGSPSVYILLLMVNE